MASDSFEDSLRHGSICVHCPGTLRLLHEPVQELHLGIAHNDRFVFPCIHGRCVLTHCWPLTLRCAQATCSMLPCRQGSGLSCHAAVFPDLGRQLVGSCLCHCQQAPISSAGTFHVIPSKLLQAADDVGSTSTSWVQFDLQRAMICLSNPSAITACLEPPSWQQAGGLLLRGHCTIDQPEPTCQHEGVIARVPCGHAAVHWHAEELAHVLKSLLLASTDADAVEVAPLAKA